MPWRLLAAILWLACLRPAAADEPHSYDGIRRLRRAEFRTQHPFASPGQLAPPGVHLFIGVPSVNPERRAAIRGSWGKLAGRQHGVVLRFFTHRDEGAHPDEAEAESAANPCADACGDVVFIGDQLLSGGGLLPGQNGVTQKVYLLFEHAVTFFSPDFVMKADDDTFVNIPVVLSVLAAEHHSRGAIYFGRVARAPELGGGGEDNGADSPFASYLEDTLARSQLPVYAAGPGYVISGAAIQAIVAANNLVGLRHNYHEDVAVGVWLSGLLIRFIAGDMAGVDIMDFMEVGKDPDPEAARFCPGAAEGPPYAWIHGLKRPGDMAHVLALAQPCMEAWEAAARTAPDHR